MRMEIIVGNLLQTVDIRLSAMTLELSHACSSVCKCWLEQWRSFSLFHFLAATFDRVDQAKRDGVCARVCSDTTGRAGRGEPRVSDGDGADASPPGLRQPRGVALR